MDEERILLGSWLLGYNLSDMQQFQESDFCYNGVFRMLKTGHNALEISRTINVPIAELAKMQAEYSYTFYRQIVESWTKQKILLQISKLSSESDVKRVREKIDFLLSARDQIKADSGFANLLDAEMERRKNEKPVRYGIPSLDRLTGGIRRKELTALAARPSVGKSALALQIALRVQSDKQKVLFFPLEMSIEQTLDRVLLMNGLANQQELRTGKMDMGKLELAKDFLNEIETSGRLKIYEGQNEIEKIRYAVKQEKPFLAIVDQLTQLRSNKSFSSKREQFAYMTNALKEMTMKENIAILLLCQINRDAQNCEPNMSNLKESGSIEEDSDNVILLHRLSQEDMREPELWDNETPMLVKLEKHRSGSIGNFIAAFNHRKLNFYERA